MYMYNLLFISPSLPPSLSPFPSLPLLLLQYTFYNMKAYRNEIVVMELYDPRNETEWVLNSNTKSYNFTFLFSLRSVWSSLAPPTLPVVTSQSYLFGTGIISLSVTVTMRGITHRDLLCKEREEEGEIEKEIGWEVTCMCISNLLLLLLLLLLFIIIIPVGLSSGHIFSLDKDLLDPRRNITPNQELMWVITVHAYINITNTCIYLNTCTLCLYILCTERMARYCYCCGRRRVHL